MTSFVRNTSLIFKFKPLFNFRSIILGRAIVADTEKFIEKSKIALPHILRSSKFAISPIIHGPPLGVYGSNIGADILLTTAIVKNRSNCVYVYCKDENGTWFTNCLDVALDEGMIKRSELVTIADIGYISSPSQILVILKDVLKKCKLEHVDMVVMKYTFPHSSEDFDKCMLQFEDLCKQDIIHSYGLHVDVSPFNCHKPTQCRKFEKSYGVPEYLEEYSISRLKRLDLIMYPLSPTVCEPATLLLLPPDASLVEEGDLDEDYDDTRNFSRCALYPLTCYRGKGPEIHPDEIFDDEERLEELRNKYSKKVEERGGDDRGVFVFADNDVNPNANSDMADRFNDPAIFLASGLLDEETEKMFCDDIDEISPELQVTPMLHEKVMLAVLAYGCDVMVLEAEISVHVGKFRLTEDHLLDPEDVEELFETFMIPKGIIDAYVELENNSQLEIENDTAVEYQQPMQGRFYDSSANVTKK